MERRAPVIAECAREVGAITVAVVTMPYRFEGVRRTDKAEAGLKTLSERVDTVIKIRNDEILHSIDPKTPLTAAFKCIDEVLCHVVKTLLCVLHGVVQVGSSDDAPNNFLRVTKIFH